MKYLITLTALTVLLFFGLAQRAQAKDFCAASLYLKAVGGNDTLNKNTLFGFTLNAGAPKTISNAILAFETQTGWYSATVREASTGPTTNHFIERDGTHRAMQAWASPVMYLQFPQPVSLMNAFLLGANGQACPPQPRWQPATQVRAPATIRDPQYPDATTLPPQTGNMILKPKLAKPFYNTNSAQPFRSAGVQTQVPPDYPEDAALHGAHGTSQVLVTINADGSLAEATLFQSSGEIVLDEATLKAARETTYQSAVAYCQPVPGSYLFKSTFQY
jgi:TonB family protein